MVGRRDDGYHELDSLIAFADVGDLIGVEVADTLTLALDGPFAEALDAGPDNLVLRAAEALAEHAGITAGASLTLIKKLPVASGIGGGSADAAAALHLLNRFWRIGLDDAALALIGQSIGADVPVCLFGRTARMQGIGEKITPGPDLPEIGLLLVNPGVGVSTAAVFGARQGAYSVPALLPASFATTEALTEFLSRCHNDLLVPARQLSPEIEGVLTEIAAREDCLFASLSGSGATCFGIFPNLSSARSAASVLAKKQPGWWVHAGDFLAMTPPLENIG